LIQDGWLHRLSVVSSSSSEETNDDEQESDDGDCKELFLVFFISFVFDLLTFSFVAMLKSALGIVDGATGAICVICGALST
jgi:hypothetical protein